MSTPRCHDTPATWAEPAPLPEDPAQLKVIIALREAEGRAKDLELRVKELELANKGKELQEADGRLRDRDARVRALEREKERLNDRLRSLEGRVGRAPLAEHMGYQAVLKCLEFLKSPLRRREGARAPRAACGRTFSPPMTGSSPPCSGRWTSVGTRGVRVSLRPADGRGRSLGMRMGNGRLPILE